ncbi:hydrogenase maturation protease [Mycolicibacterium rufum]|uniref:Hydrogenase maturation protease n=1 Tax=Mycolicibacterium rufum TaxID=318424 RepID=A0A9X2YFF8_9MYCO|nr:hydrogenase maturation protease [Mycolicibacterium rufum]MCV7072982.1 hydrogenase maturation protease [Mycolicibacterium rufum]ULP38812.1 hydrogenase maturation protease [Mycolicibacterium rufum]
MNPQAGSPAVSLEPPGCDVLVIGCGNLLRGDDGVGPVLVRHLWERGVPDGAKLVDGGTAGMDVAFQMRGARQVVIIDAAATGSAPGTMFRVPGSELAELPPLQGLHTHSFRWDHAIAFARWALGEDCPTDITVFLIEVAGVEMGADLSEPVTAAMEQVIALIERDHLAPLRPTVPREVTVEFTADGYLRLDAATAAARFPSDAVAAVLRDGALWLIPLRGPRSGGLLLKQRTPAGDRSVLVSELLRESPLCGVFRACWDDDQSALRIPVPGAEERER